MPGDDAVPVAFDQRDEVLDRLQAGAFRAGAPAAQVLGRMAGMLVVEGLEVLAPAQILWESDTATRSELSLVEVNLPRKTTQPDSLGIRVFPRDPVEPRVIELVRANAAGRLPTSVYSDSRRACRT